jgi:1,4-alpha-glucan branching enzyme
VHWLTFVIDEARIQGLPLATLPDALDRFELVEDVPIAASSWGRPKDLSTWDAPPVAEFAFTARRAELETVATAAAVAAPGPALERAARELLALQSSDWAFQVTHELADDYPLRRVKAHARELDAALEAMKDSAPVPDAKLRNLAPELDLSSLLAP